MNFITRQGRALLFTAVLVVVGAVCTSNGADRPSALVGQWIYNQDENHSYFDIRRIELFSDGTGVVGYRGVSGGISITWKVENKRLVFLSAEDGFTFNYEVSGYVLTLVDDDDNIAIFVKKGMEEKKKEEKMKKISQLVEQCNNYMNKGMFDKAIELSTEIIRMDPTSAIAYAYRGSAYNENGDFDKALADFNKAIQLAPNVAVPYGSRGFVYFKKGDYDKALADFNKAVQLDPNNHNYNMRGYVYLKKGDYNNALANFNKAVQLAPNEANSYDSRGEAYLTIGDYDKAIADYSKALQLDPNLESAKVGLEKAKQKKQGR
jgi:tetratricopeptide (TPR) repeat protein